MQRHIVKLLLMDHVSIKQRGGMYMRLISCAIWSIEHIPMQCQASIFPRGPSLWLALMSVAAFPAFTPCSGYCGRWQVRMIEVPNAWVVEVSFFHGYSPEINGVLGHCTCKAILGRGQALGYSSELIAESCSFLHQNRHGISNSSRWEVIIDR